MDKATIAVGIGIIAGFAVLLIAFGLWRSDIAIVATAAAALASTMPLFLDQSRRGRSCAQRGQPAPDRS